MKRLLFALLMVLVECAFAALTEEQVVAAVIAQEARGEGTAGMTAVGEVIARRAQEKKTSALKVVTFRVGKKHAFSSLNRTTPEKLHARMKDEAGYDEAYRIACVVCRSPQDLPNTTKNATHFTLKTEKPYWAKGRKPLVVIGRHAFYRLPY